MRVQSALGCTLSTRPCITLKLLIISAALGVDLQKDLHASVPGSASCVRRRPFMELMNFAMDFCLCSGFSLVCPPTACITLKLLIISSVSPVMLQNSGRGPVASPPCRTRPTATWPWPDRSAPSCRGRGWSGTPWRSPCESSRRSAALSLRGPASP